MRYARTPQSETNLEIFANIAGASHFKPARINSDQLCFISNCLKARTREDDLRASQFQREGHQSLHSIHP